MKTIRLLSLSLLLVFVSNVLSANDAVEPVKTKKTAQEVFDFAAQMETFDAEAFKAEVKDLSPKEKVKLVRLAAADAKAAKLAGQKASVGMYILAVLLPPVAVGIHTDWGRPTLYNVLWCCLGGLPGIVHAFVVLGK